MSKFSGWVTETCRKCKKAFMYYDEEGIVNDEPTGKFLCPSCAKIYKTSVKKSITPEQYLKEMKITDKKICKEFKKRCKNFKGKRKSYQNILKEAIEIAGYYN